MSDDASSRGPEICAMDCRGSVDSEREGTGRAASGPRGNVIEDQGHSADNLDREGAVSPENGHSDHSSCESKPEIELSSGSKAEERENFGRGSYEEAVSGHSSQAEEKATPSSGRGGSESSAGGGQVFHTEEPPPPTTPMHDNSPADKCETGGNGHSNKGRSTPNIIRWKSVNADNVNGECTGGQTIPSDMLGLAERLSEPVGKAVATVLHEVLEQNGDFDNSAPSPVDELSRLLGKALKESLFFVLENDQRALFLESFKNSFITSYQTVRSVRRAFAKSGGRLGSSTKNPYPYSRKGFQSKPRRISPSQPNREKARKNLEGTDGLEIRKRHLMASSGGLKMENNTTARPQNYTLELMSEEEIASFTPRRYRQRGQRVHSPCSSSGKTCLDESLQSTFFSTSTLELEPEPHSETAGSCSKSYLNESLESSFLNSSNPEVDGQQTGSTEISSVNTISESMGSRLSQPTADDGDALSESVDSEDTWDVNMFTAASSSESDDLVLVDGEEVIASLHGHPGSEFAVTFDSWNFEENQNHSRCVVEYKVNQPPPRHAVGNDSVMDGSETVGSSESLDGRCGDSLQHTKQPISSDSLRRGVVGESVQDTKSVEYVDSQSKYRRQSLQQETSPRVSRDPFGQEHANTPLNRSGNHLSSAVTLGASAGTAGETSSMSGVSRMNLDRTLSRGADALGRLHVTEEGGFENLLVHRRENLWGDVAPRRRPAREDAVVPPFFNRGLRASRRTLLERYIEATEAQNHLKQLEIAHSMELLLVKKDHLQLQSESNTLMKENVDLGRTKIDFKEFELEDRKLTTAHRELSTTCADELVAGLCLMLLALAYSAWKFSYTRLSKVVAMCQLPRREPRPGGWLGTNWFANSMDAFTWRMQAWTCELTKAGRMGGGLILIALVASSLVRRSVTSSSQTMPITMIVVVLAGICGFFGKISIDSLGGDGNLWLSFWEVLCFLHAFATSCTPWLYKYLYGPSSKFYQTRASVFMKFCSLCARFSFHMFLVFALPVMAGLLPFASLSELSNAFWEYWETGPMLGPY